MCIRDRYAVAKGDTASIDPKEWAIVEGRLYLNYNQSIGEEWGKDKAEYIKKADNVWKAWSAEE